MNNRVAKLFAWLWIASLARDSSHAQQAPSTNTARFTNDFASLERNGKRDARVHDPSTIVKCKDEYWLFATGNGVASWRSKDLMHWEKGPPVFSVLPEWRNEIEPGHRGYFWAPDIIHLRDKYLLYYSVSRWGKNT